MIVDCHTHIWESPSQLGAASSAQAFAGAAKVGGTPQQHAESAQPVAVSFVLGFASRQLNAAVPNALIAGYVRQQPDRLVGFAGIDPSDPSAARDELKRATEELGLVGVVVAPAAQAIHPADSRAMRLYELVADRKLPLIFDAAAHSLDGGKLVFSQPVLLEEVAQSFPSTPIVIAHLGYPWVEQAVVMLARYSNVYADVAGLLRQPWAAYNAMLSVAHHGVTRKLLFGSDFPFGTATSAVEAFYSLNQISHGSNLPNIPRERLRSVVEQDALSLLGLRVAAASRPTDDDSEN